MIRALRQRHRVIVIVLAIVLPLLALLALAVRRPIPTMETLPIDRHPTGTEP